MTDFILIALATAALTYLAVTPWSGFRLGRVVHCRRRSQAHRPCLTARNNKKPAWVVNEVVRLKAYLPPAGSITLAHTFNRLHGATKKMTVSKSFVTYTVRANLLAIVRLRHEAKHATPRAVARNAVCGIDMTGKTDATGKLHMIFGAIDHGTRRVMPLRVLPNKSSWVLLGHLCMAIGHYGKPRSVRTDNESVFTSRVFRFALLCLGIRHQRIDLGCPERPHRALLRNLEAVSQLPGCGRARPAAGVARCFQRLVLQRAPARQLAWRNAFGGVVRNRSVSNVTLPHRVFRRMGWAVEGLSDSLAITRSPHQNRSRRSSIQTDAG